MWDIPQLLTWDLSCQSLITWEVSPSTKFLPFFRLPLRVGIFSPPSSSNTSFEPRPFLDILQEQVQSWVGIIFRPLAKNDIFQPSTKKYPQPPYSTKFRMKFNCFETVPVATCATAETCYTVYGHPARNGNPHNVASPTINTPKSSPLWLYDGLW